MSEARDLGEIDRFKFNTHTKIYTAAPPDTLHVDEKNLKEYYIFNCLGLIITTNHKTDGIYLPPGDRRHYVAWSKSKPGDFTKEYWNDFWAWYQNSGGFGHVGAYLTQLDLTGFDAKKPPPKTPAFWDIVLANASPEDAELADVIDSMGNPDILTLVEVIEASTKRGAATEWLLERRSRRAIPHRLERCGYAAVHNPDKQDGLWKINEKRQVIYGRSDSEPKHLLEAAKRRQEGPPGGPGSGGSGKT